MIVTVMATNGGPHPPDKWAHMSANKVADLVQIDEASVSDIAAQARKAKPRFALDLSDALEPIFAKAQAEEKAAVQSGARVARNDPFDAEQYVSEAMSVVSACSASTMFSSHFNEPDVTSVVRRIITENLLDAMNIERSWAFDAKGL